MHRMVKLFSWIILLQAMALSACQSRDSTLKPTLVENILLTTSPRPNTTTASTPEPDDLKLLTPTTRQQLETPSPASTLSPPPNAATQPEPTRAEDENEIPGRIFVSSVPGHYAVFETPYFGHLVETTVSSVLTPSKAIVLAFANYSDQVAYLTVENGTQLWLADLNLVQVEKVWVDDTNWLGEHQNSDDLLLTWGPQDHTIIVTSLIDEPRSIVYNIKFDTVEIIGGRCNHLGLPPYFEQPVVFCTDPGKKTGLLLTGSGEQEQFISEPIGLTIEVQDWAFSPDGLHVLFATKQNALVVYRDQGQQVQLPLTYVPSLCCGLMPPKDELQWSQDGTRLLIYGQGADDNDYEGWFVLDSSTGEPVWAGMPSETVKVLQEMFVTSNDATLSPDGQWLATSYLDFTEAYRYSAITSLVTGQVIEISEGEMEQVKWSR